MLPHVNTDMMEVIRLQGVAKVKRDAALSSVAVAKVAEEADQGVGEHKPGHCHVQHARTSQEVLRILHRVLYRQHLYIPTVLF